MKILALDVGGTAVKSALVQEDGSLLDYRTTPTGGLRAEMLVQRAISVAAEYQDFDALAVSMTGQIDQKTQTVRARSNGKALERADFPVGNILREAVERPVFVLNDANAAALGEACFGAGREMDSFLCITYGTGVGGGIIWDRRLLTGQRGIAGEVGHLVTHAGGRLCRCGHRGCYQEYASTTALLREAQKICPELENARQLFDRLPETPKLQQAVDGWIREIVEGLCSLAYTFDPQAFVLGGGVMERPEILAQVRQQYAQRVIPSFSDIPLLQAQLGNRAGMLGAAAFAQWELSGGEGAAAKEIIRRKEA